MAIEDRDIYIKCIKTKDYQSFYAWLDEYDYDNLTIYLEFRKDEILKSIAISMDRTTPTKWIGKCKNIR